MDTIFIGSLPLLPGVYLFKDELHQVLYIGKAKNLKNRLRSYITNAKKDWKIQALLDEHAQVTYTVTHSEIEAGLLEAQLIGQYKPKYNVLLKSGNPFIYLLFTQDTIPTLQIVRNKKKKGTYFGPFLQRSQARGVYTFLMDTFKLLLCNKKIAHGCLDYHLGRCAGLCLNDFDRHDYLLRLDLAHQALKKNHAGFLATIEKKIKRYADCQAFEKAQQLTVYRQNLETIFATLHTKYADSKYVSEVLMMTNPAPQLAKTYSSTQPQLKNALNTTDTIATIDCFDISHFQGHQMVGACVRYTNGIPDKNNMRKFNIKTLDTQNDYAALQEVVQRRYKNHADIPDLILIDGGKGQRNAITTLMPNTRIASLAKREERLFTNNYPDGILLDIKSSLGKLLIGLRNYAHHFAISHHRVRRNKTIPQ